MYIYKNAYFFCEKCFKSNNSQEYNRQHIMRINIYNIYIVHYVLTIACVTCNIVHIYLLYRYTVCNIVISAEIQLKKL